MTLTATDNDIDAEDAVVSVGGTTNPSGLTVNAAALTIRDDDTRGVMVSKDTLSIREHDAGETPARGTYTVVLESEPTADVVIAIAVMAPHETAVLVSPTPLRFTPSNWQTPQLVTVMTTPDADADELTATITHTVTDGDYGANTVTAADVTVTVTDDESLSTAVTLRVSPEEVSEGAGNTQVTVTGELNGAPRTADTVVTVTVPAGTATEGDDFSVSTVTPLTIATGQVSGTMTFTLTPVNDDIDEPDETVTVEGSTTPTVDLAVTGTTVTITDDDPPEVTGPPDDPRYVEGGTGPVATYYTASNPADVPLTWSVIGTDAEFFTIPDGVLGFKQPPDFEASRGSVYQVTVQASDGTDPAGTLPVTVSGAGCLGQGGAAPVTAAGGGSPHRDGERRPGRPAPGPGAPRRMVLDAVPPPRLHY